MSNYAIVELSVINIADGTNALVANFNSRASDAQGESQILFGRRETLENITNRLLGQDWSKVATQLKSASQNPVFYIQHPDEKGLRPVQIDNGKKPQRAPVAA